MLWIRRIGVVAIVPLTLVLGCGAPDDSGSEPLGTVSNAAYHIQCNQVEPSDVLVSELVLLSLNEGYSLTLLYEDAAGNIAGTSMPDAVAGQVELINTVPEAQANVLDALDEVSGEDDYTVSSLTKVAGETGCTDLEAWTPTGTTLIDTPVFDATGTEPLEDVLKEFGKVCPLVKNQGTNKGYVDPAGDGSTNLPPSSTVSATGVTANAWGLCPSSASTGTYCKLYYATGVNYTGRKCQYYYGYKRCLLY
jgi:hypothetical protein